tara:strand:- start:2613 stop:2999 length:387 start_codon:yes stop_codon:yes gene_type:complete
MQVDTYIKLTDELLAKAKKISLLKGEEYTVSDNDKFKNFKSVAERTHTSAEIVCTVYLLKHMDSIRNYVLHGKESCDETISGRIIDAVNYLCLLHGILIEKKEYEALDKKIHDNELGVGFAQKDIKNA